MTNTYYLMRHGHSQANKQGIITCDPAVCISDYGLTDRGHTQASEAAKRLKTMVKATPIIVSSDFLRAHETANIVAAEFGVSVIKDARLRERNFGKLHGQSDDTYVQIWNITDKDPAARPDGVESDGEIVARVQGLIAELESQYTEREIILVSHGDPLNIINAQYVHGDTTKQTHNFANAEIRPLLSLTPSVTIDV